MFCRSSQAFILMFCLELERMAIKDVHNGEIWFIIWLTIGLCPLIRKSFKNLQR